MNIDCLNMGKRLHETRLQKGITQEEMAKKLNISINEIRNLENGKLDISLRDFVTICEFLNISIYEVLNEKSENIMVYMNKDLYELIVRCNVKNQELIYKMVKLLLKNQVV